MNSLFIWNSTRTKLPTDFNSLTGVQNRTFVSRRWNITTYNNNDTNNPISDIFISVSPPCGQRSADYYQRPIKVDQIYQISECLYSKNGSKLHTMYQAGGFEETEGNIYMENGFYR